MSEVEREEYAHRIALITAPFIAAVHRHDHAEMWHWLAQIEAVPSPVGVNPAVAALVLMAAQVPPDTNLAERLAWVHPDVVAACRAGAA